MVATHPLTSPRDPVIPLVVIGTTLLVGPLPGAAIGVSDGIAAKSRGDDANLIQGISDPSPYVSSRLQATLTHHVGVHFVPVKVGDYGKSSDGLRDVATGGAPRFSLSVVSRGFGLRPVKGSPEDRTIFYRADVTLADWAGQGAQPILRTECRLESLLALGEVQLRRTSGKVWLQERLNHLATRCVRIVEEEICRRDRPSIPLECCATTPDEIAEAEDVGDL